MDMEMQEDNIGVVWNEKEGQDDEENTLVGKVLAEKVINKNVVKSMIRKGWNLSDGVSINEVSYLLVVQKWVSSVAIQDVDLSEGEGFRMEIKKIEYGNPSCEGIERGCGGEDVRFSDVVRNIRAVVMGEGIKDKEASSIGYVVELPSDDDGGKDDMEVSKLIEENEVAETS
ncbi:uncharacterized protein G2W53_011897 [Senna tora]|uniref:Uncharacterized protein n=1 Tax=Senna tora TaxID=362788 RepID=A0A834WSG6_9FABA|nr:uncharacterized protein G2W53_011897 [Senna tora]